MYAPDIYISGPIPPSVAMLVELAKQTNKSKQHT